MSATAQHRRDALAFWEKHGLAAAMDHADVCRSTLHAWRTAYRQHGAAGLSGKRRAPKRTRRRAWPPALLAEIRRQRKEIPNLGPDKLHVLLKPWCAERRLPLPSARTIGRLIADAPDKMRHAPQRLTPKGKTKPRNKTAPKHRRPNLSAATPGECVAFDTIVLFVFGLRRYILTATDHHSRFAFAIAMPRANSKNTAQFAALVQAVFPAPIREILTDNGSEFAGAFDAFARKQHWRHNYTYPKCPKMNARNERFNRTLQEEFVNHQEHLLADDLRTFNNLMLEYLGKYNTQRPHHALQYQTPCDAIAKHPQQKSRIGWQHTAGGVKGADVLRWPARHPPQHPPMTATPAPPRLRMGVDVGGTKMEGVVLDAGGGEVWRRRVGTVTPAKMPGAVIPCGWKTRKRSDYVFLRYGIQRL